MASTKPRRRYRPRTVAANPIALAANRAATIGSQEREEILQPIRAAFKAMREGVGSEANWLTLAGTAQMATRIEQQGVMRGLQGHLAAADAALQAIRQRASEGGEWRAPALHLGEIDALDTFVWLHAEQLQRLSRGELLAALARAESVRLVSAAAVPAAAAPVQEALAWS